MYIRLEFYLVPLKFLSFGITSRYNDEPLDLLIVCETILRMFTYLFS